MLFGFFAVSYGVKLALWQRTLKKKNKQFDALSLCGYEESVKLKFISIDIKYVLSKKKMEHRYRTFSSETCVHM